MTNLNLKTILGIKVKRLREARRLTLAELTRQTGLSTSYLAEVEAGKKYPKADKIWLLAEALQCPYDELISTKLDHEFSELQQFLTAPGLRDFPFDMFGLPAGDVMKLLTRAPHEVAALIRTLGDIARQYNIGVEHFLHAALRCYQELTGNYYEAIETEAERFAARLELDEHGSVRLGALKAWVAAHLTSEIDEATLGVREPLRQFRAVFLPGARARLLLNPELTDSQKAAVLAREIGYRVLGLKARSFTTPPDREDSFDQVLNDFKASYFAGSLLIPRARLVGDLKRFFRLPTWQGEALLHLLDRHQATPEILMYRLSQLVPSQFGLRAHFLKFIDEGGHFRLVKQLNLSELDVPPGIGGDEHYCRRWLSTRLLVDAAAWQRRGPRRAHGPLVGAQHSRFRNGKAFFCLGLAQPQPLRPDITTSVTMGFNVDEKLYHVVRFARDRTIPEAIIDGTCERCALSPPDCHDRVAPPVLHRALLVRAERERALQKLIDE